MEEAMYPNFVLLYVDNPTASAAFYGDLLGQEPIETSPTFALFALPNGLMFGLWSRHTVEPKATASGGGGELAFAVESREAVKSAYGAWQEKGLEILQEPCDMDFGHTFVALDPDGHRLRVFFPVEEDRP
jgi:catechol 2,3-dioxygenase-like lactoylglutathione lyase family enzyme